MPDVRVDVENQRSNSRGFHSRRSLAVYREDYLLPLRALSHNRIAEPLISALSRVQRWSAAFDYSLPRAQLRESLARCNAFQEDLRSYKLLFPTARPQTIDPSGLGSVMR